MCRVRNVSTPTKDMKALVLLIVIRWYIRLFAYFFVQKDFYWVDSWIRGGDYCQVLPESESEFEAEDDFWRLRFAAAPPPGLLKALLKRQVFFVAQFSWSPMIEDVRKTRIQRPQKSGRRPRRPRQCDQIDFFQTPNNLAQNVKKRQGLFLASLPNDKISDKQETPVL